MALYGISLIKILSNKETNEQMHSKKYRDRAEFQHRTPGRKANTIELKRILPNTVVRYCIKGMVSRNKINGTIAESAELDQSATVCGADLALHCLKNQSMVANSRVRVDILVSP